MEQIGQAVQAIFTNQELREKQLLQNWQSNSEMLTVTEKKKESLPKTIVNTFELLEAYNKTDLEYCFCVMHFIELGALKMLDITELIQNTWYREFLRLGWTKAIFMQQFEALKRKNIYGRIDFADWLETRIMYNEHELANAVNQRIERLIEKGRDALKQGAVISAQAEEHIRLAAAKSASDELRVQMMNKFYEIEEAEKQKVYETNKEIQKRIRALTNNQSRLLIRYLRFKKLIISESKCELEKAVQYCYLFSPLCNHQLISAIQAKII